MTLWESYWCVKGFHFPFAHHRACSKSWHPASVPGSQGKKLELPAWQVHLQAAWSQCLRGLVRRGWGTGSLLMLRIWGNTLWECVDLRPATLCSGSSLEKGRRNPQSCCQKICLGGTSSCDSREAWRSHVPEQKRHTRAILPLWWHKQINYNSLWPGS